MKNILKYIAIGLIIATTNSACVSMWTHSQWKEAKSQQAVKVTADGEQVLVGVDLTALGYIKENPGLATVAALADIGIAYGVYTVSKDVLGGDSGGNDGGNNNTDDGGAGRDNNDNDSAIININVNQ